MMTWPKKIKSILSVGIDLNKYGTNGWALTKDQALQALDQLQKLQVPIAGGDVYQTVDGNPQSTYDNWFSNHNKGEAFADYVSRSVKEARNYISNYKPSGKDFLIVLVPNLTLVEQTPKGDRPSLE